MSFVLIRHARIAVWSNMNISIGCNRISAKNAAFIICIILYECSLGLIIHRIYDEVNRIPVEWHATEEGKKYCIILLCWLCVSGKFVFTCSALFFIRPTHSLHIRSSHSIARRDECLCSLLRVSELLLQHSRTPPSIVHMYTVYTNKRILRRRDPIWRQMTLWNQCLESNKLFIAQMLFASSEIILILWNGILFRSFQRWLWFAWRAVYNIQAASVWVENPSCGRRRSVVNAVCPAGTGAGFFVVEKHVKNLVHFFACAL